MGIEPTYPAWKAGVLPLNYTRKEFSKRFQKCFEKHNAQSRNRTSDTRIFSPLLYQLSYLGLIICNTDDFTRFLSSCQAKFSKLCQKIIILNEIFPILMTGSKSAGQLMGFCSTAAVCLQKSLLSAPYPLARKDRNGQCSPQVHIAQRSFPDNIY